MADESPTIALARTDEIPASALDYLDAAERQRHDAMRSKRRRREFVGGRMLAKHLLARVSGKPAAAQAIRIAESGQPESDAACGLSIAHSNGLLACAAAPDSKVGVDIELPSTARHTARISRACFTKAESDWLSSAPPESFYRLWVLKEAWLKARGSGLSGGLGSLSLRIDEPHIAARADDGDAGMLWLYEWRGVPVGLATGRVIGMPSVFEWSGERARLEPVDDRPIASTVGV